MWKGKGREGEKAGEAGPSVITREEGMGGPSRLQGQGHGLSELHSRRCQ